MEQKITDRNKILTTIPKDDLAKLVHKFVLEGNVTTDEALDYIACSKSPYYFINYFIQIYDSQQTKWIPFTLWDAQKRVLNKIHNNNKVVVLKARQVGLTWLTLSYILWDALFNYPASALILSKTEPDALYLLSRERLRGMYERLPVFLQASHIEIDSAKIFTIARPNNTLSSIKAVSTTRGDGFTGTMVLVDEADLVENLRRIILSVAPVVDAGGKLILISKPDRSKPDSYFKKIFNGAMNGDNNYVGDFIAWHEAPYRTQAWYDKQVQDSLTNDGTLDSVYESYPETIAQALSPIQASKRLPEVQLKAVYKKLPVVTNYKYKDLKVFVEPNMTTGYAIGVDVSEGIPTGDYATAIVVNGNTGLEVATYAAKIPPRELAHVVRFLSKMYNNAPVLVERNNHGHLFINAATELGVPLVSGHDFKIGWLQNRVTKPRGYDQLHDIILSMNCGISNEETYFQLSSLDKDTLSAPNGFHDDLAIAFMLAQECRKFTKDIDPFNKNVALFNAREWDRNQQ